MSPTPPLALPALASVKLWIFDLDGTLIDSRLDLVTAVNATLAWLGRDALEEERVVGFVGDGADDLIRKSLRAAGLAATEVDATAAKALAWFLDYYGDHCLDRTVPYPGARELLEELRARGLPLAMLTNKPEKPTRTILAHLGWDRLFDVVIGGDGPLGKKPDPRGMGYILESMNTAPNDAVLVGDSLQDLRTARAAGVPFIAYLEGLGDADAVRAAGPDLAVEDLAALHPRIWNDVPRSAEGGHG